MLLFIAVLGLLSYPPASEASREVANLTKWKNPQTHVNGVKEFVCLSTNSGLAKQNGLKNCEIYAILP